MALPALAIPLAGAVARLAAPTIATTVAGEGLKKAVSAFTPEVG